jgi:hypothetical protein
MQQFGHLQPADIGINFVKIVHGQSKEARPGPNGEPALPLGTIFLSRDRKVIQPDTPFIPLLRAVRYIKWDGRPGEGRMAFTCTDPNDRRIKDCDGLAWKPDPRNPSKQLKPEVTAYVNLYVLLKDCPDEPVMLSFSRTGAAAGRKLTQQLIKATLGGKLPLYSLMFKLGKPSEETDGQNLWYHHNCIQNGHVPPEALDAAKTMYEKALILNSMSTGAEFANAESDEEPQDEPAAQPANVLSASSKLVQTAPVAPTAAAPAPVQPQPTPAPTIAPARSSVW